LDGQRERDGRVDRAGTVEFPEPARIAVVEPVDGGRRADIFTQTGDLPELL